MATRTRTTSGGSAPTRAASTTRWRYRIAREAAAIGAINAALERALSDAAVPSVPRHDLAVVLDELLANVLHHAEGADGGIALDVALLGRELRATLRYRAARFDPTTSAAPTSPRDIATARPGGVGIAIAHALTDALRYAYVAGENRIEIRKRF